MTSLRSRLWAGGEGSLPCRLALQMPKMRSGSGHCRCRSGFTLACPSAPAMAATPYALSCKSPLTVSRNESVAGVKCDAQSPKDLRFRKRGRSRQLTLRLRVVDLQSNARLFPKRRPLEVLQSAENRLSKFICGAVSESHGCGTIAATSSPDESSKEQSGRSPLLPPS